MLTYYCPNCWKELKGNEKICPFCGAELQNFSEIEFEEKLLSALYHPVSERRNIAAQVLGNRKCIKAIPEFLKIIKSGKQDFYFLKEVLLAVAKINHPLRDDILRIGSEHPSELVSKYAKELIRNLEVKDSNQSGSENTC